MLLQQRSVDVRLVAEAARQHVSGVDAHVHAQRAERRVATPTRVADVRPVGLRDGADGLAVQLRVRLDGVLAQVAALGERLVADAAREPLPGAGGGGAGVLLGQVLAQLHLVHERPAAQVAQVRLLADVALVVTVKVGALRETPPAPVALERFLAARVRPQVDLQQSSSIRIIKKE